MRKKQIFVLLTLFAFLNAASLGIFIVSTTASTIVEMPEYLAVDINSGLAGNVVMPKITGDLGQYSTVESFESTPPVGTEVWDWYLIAISGDPTMTLRAVSGNVEIWVQNDLSFPDGDPRNADPYNTMITDEMINYLAVQFNTAIYPNLAEYFGAPLDRDGANTFFEALGWPEYRWDWIETDNPQRVILKVLNYRDDNYYDPTYPYYVAGFFADLYTNVYYDRNMVHIDSWRWWQRLGPEGQEWFPERSDLVVTRPNLYESVTAHEFQHNIHFDHNPDDPNFMNEGSSMFAELVSGYPVDWGGINSFLYTPDNSLTEWEDQGGINVLADYGQAFLWTTYLTDHYSTEEAKFLSRFMQIGEPGIAGIDLTLQDLGFDERFDDVFLDWRLANLIHSGDGIYDYISIDFDDPEAGDINTIDIKKSWMPWTTGTSLGNTISILGYDTGISKLGKYGTDYLKFTKLRDRNEPIFNFDGNDEAGTSWEKVDGVWYSTLSSALNDISIVGEFVLPLGTTLLTFDTFYNIEPLWDFGFVQISNDGGVTWESLANEYTTTDHDGAAHPNIVANLPGLTGSGGWTTMSFDISHHAEETVLISFRYMTDWSVQYPGWWVDNINIDGTPIEDDFVPDPPLAETDFVVTLIGVEDDDDGPKYKLIGEVSLDDLTEMGSEFLDHYIEKGGYVIAMISSTEGPIDYKFSVEKTK